MSRVDLAVDVAVYLMIDVAIDVELNCTDQLKSPLFTEIASSNRSSRVGSGGAC